jgi:hypothetical protein
MKKIFVMLFVAVMSLSVNANPTTGSTQTSNPVKVNLKGKSLTVNGETFVFNLSEEEDTVVFLDIAKATWAIAIPKPEKTNWREDGDWLHIYKYQGRYCYSLQRTSFEFTSNKYESKPDYDPNWDLVEHVDVAEWCTPAFAKGMNIGYAYLEKGDDRFVLVYGNNASYIK